MIKIREEIITTIVEEMLVRDQAINKTTIRTY